MNRFRLSKRAETDVAEIRRNIAKDNESAANRFVGELFDLFQSLGRSPEIGQIRSELRPNLRSFSHGNYVVLYYSENDRAGIVGIVHGARDIDAILPQEADDA
jgi:toxin ParE1/3/4